MEDARLWVKLAEELRERIRTGDLRPGDRLPSRPQLMRDRGVSDGVVNRAFEQLAREELIERRPGSGTFVIEPRPVQRLRRTGSPTRVPGAPPFLLDLHAPAKVGSYRCTGRSEGASTAVAIRLEVEPDSDVIHAGYVWYADDDPAAVASSWEPGKLVRGTPIAFPEDGPYSGQGVIIRMRQIGVRVDRVLEEETSRPATAEEAGRVRCPEGTAMFIIRRTYLAQGQPVAFAEIAIPTTRYVLEREYSVGDDAVPPTE